LLAEVVEHLQPQRGGVFVDCTLGLGGHTAALVGAGATRVLGLDRDQTALALARDRLAALGDRVAFVHADFRDLGRVLADRGVTAVQGVLADLGVSSMQLDDAGRGFSFREAGPLDMRADRSQGAPLSARLADVDEAELTEVIREFGEERHARRVARSILRARDEGRLHDTSALASAVRRAAGGGTWSRLDPATRTFQALRIWVNDELGALRALLDAALPALAPGGRAAIIAFHSLEDRIVKQRFRAAAADGWARLITRRPLMASETEVARNPRARSAKLRVIERAA
jgi:16S rRNA (cytosine1402-N4)-methyltransferase